jgi:hypothetical protein
LRLFEHSDFNAVVTATAAATELEESFVEKDYYITEILRIVAERYRPGQVIFKGGTSLSKAWGLIQRLSEDVDLLFVRSAFDPSLGRGRTKTELQAMTEAVAAHPGLRWDRERTAIHSDGWARSDSFMYDQRFAQPGIAPAVISEPGVRGGTYPIVDRDIESEVGRYLWSIDRGNLADDVAPFTMTVLHFRRTFVEKLFIVHALVERLKSDGSGLDRNARHYIDLHALAGEEEIERMLESDEYLEIKTDYQEISLRFFKKSYAGPPDLSFANSDGLFPAADLRDQIAVDYDEQCRTLCYGPYPSFDEVLGRFESMRDLL